MRKIIIASLMFATSFAFAKGADTLPPELAEVQKKLFVKSFNSFVKDYKIAHKDLKLEDAALTPPSFDEKLQRNDWITAFAEHVASKAALTPEQSTSLKEKATEMFTSYYHDKGFSRVSFLQPFTKSGGSAKTLKVEKIKLVKDYPSDHTLDVPGYVSERFPKELQDFVHERHASLVVDDSNCDDTFSFQKTLGFTQAIRFMGVRDNPDSQFLFVYNPKKKSYRLAICDIHGNDDQTRILAILGPTFFAEGAERVYHKNPAPLFDFNEEGRGLKIDAKKDRVVIGFQNTVWWQLKNSSENWVRRSLTKSGADLGVFENKLTGERIISVANVYGDEILEALRVLHEKGARRWVYMGTAGGLDPNLQLGDVVIPHRFMKPDGTWFEFQNDAESAKFTPPAPAKRVSSTAQGWVGTLIEETREHLTKMKDAGVQALDVESRYFAEFTSKNNAEEKIVVLVVSDQPMGKTNYNDENATRSIPMKSITELVPHLVLSAILKLVPEKGPLPASVK